MTWVRAGRNIFNLDDVVSVYCYDWENARHGHDEVVLNMRGTDNQVSLPYNEGMRVLAYINRTRARILPIEEVVDDTCLQNNNPFRAPPVEVVEEEDDEEPAPVPQTEEPTIAELAERDLVRRTVGTLVETLPGPEDLDAVLDDRPVPAPTPTFTPIGEPLIINATTDMTMAEFRENIRQAARRDRLIDEEI